MVIKDLFGKIINKAEEVEKDASTTAEKTVEEIKDKAQDFMKGHKPPEPPKDENGNPIKPPEGFKPPMGGKPPKEPSKDENGNPIKPPEGMKPPFGWKKPTEENTNS